MVNSGKRRSVFSVTTLAALIFCALAPCRAAVAATCEERLRSVAGGIRAAGRNIGEALKANLQSSDMAWRDMIAFERLLSNAGHSGEVVDRVADAFFFLGLIHDQTGRRAAVGHISWLTPYASKALETAEDDALIQGMGGTDNNAVAPRLGRELHDQIKEAARAVAACQLTP